MKNYLSILLAFILTASIGLGIFFGFKYKDNIKEYFSNSSSSLEDSSISSEENSSSSSSSSGSSSSIDSGSSDSSDLNSAISEEHINRLLDSGYSSSYDYGCSFGYYNENGDYESINTDEIFSMYGDTLNPFIDTFNNKSVEVSDSQVDVYKYLVLTNGNRTYKILLEITSVPCYSVSFTINNNIGREISMDERVNGKVSYNVESVFYLTIDLNSIR